MKKKALAALAGAALTLSAATTGLAYQRAIGGGAAAAAAPAPPASGVIVVDWNKELLRIIGTKAQPTTVHPTRSLAILHAAMYDAVVSITHSNPPYLFARRLNAPAGARADAAAAEAGHDTLAALYPSVKGALDQQLARELGAIPDGAGKRQGIAVGHLAATLMLAARAGDGASATPPPLPAGTQPGDYRPTPPKFAPAVFTQWPNVTPFVLHAADQFRPAPPPGLSTAAYARALNEVKSLGQKTSTSRTADQTVAAQFWPSPIWTTWNEIAEKAALAHHSDLVHTARLFTLLNLSLADTAIAFYDAKYHYHLWRPITAIRDAAHDGNPATAGDPTWSPLLLKVADPSYPGAHSAISAAGAAVLSSFFGAHDRITVTSDVLPGVVRTFDSYSAAATEAGLSRIYGGVHTRIDHEAGLRLGQEVAGFVLAAAGSPGFGVSGS
ncbi:MAG TPA: vanadium-dependent haloperoxidase [Chloroflexota bacterium]|nr:vanadium-dependent haloperoxidase [Chloroflexota bacterium]